MNKECDHVIGLRNYYHITKGLQPGFLEVYNSDVYAKQVDYYKFKECPECGEPLDDPNAKIELITKLKECVKHPEEKAVLFACLLLCDYINDFEIKQACKPLMKLNLKKDE